MEEIKQGYKQTDIGVIPEDWEVKSIAEISTPVRGGSPRPAGSPKYFNGNYIPWLTVASLTNVPNAQITIDKTATSLTEAGSFHSRILEKGTLIIANSGATLGVAKILGIKCCANDGIAALLNIQSKYDKEYILYHINNITELLRNSIATGNGQPNLNTQLIGNLKFPYPQKTKEQTAIATALSDTDALIAALDKKIAKKQQIKQGAMQQLLTGKKRLPGFSGEWVEKKLGAIGKTYGGLTGKTKDDFGNGDSYYITFLNILNNPVINTDLIERVRIKSTEHQNKALKNDLFFNTSSETPEEVGICSVLLNDIENLYLNSFCFGYRINDNEVHGLFLSYLFRSKQGRELMTSLAQGATRYNLSKSLFNQSLIKMPATKTEQTAIAQILTDMDNEIAQLEKERDKYKELKAGMMQVLLTGKVRFV